MKPEKSRRQAIKTMSAGASLFALNPLSLSPNMENEVKPKKLKGNINHSVCRWCYNKIPMEQLCIEAKKIGIKSIEIVGPSDWPILKKHGLHCAMPNGGEISFVKGFNHKE